MMKCVLNDSLDHNSKVKTTSTHLQVSCGLFDFIFFPTFFIFYFFGRIPPPPPTPSASFHRIVI